MLSLRRRQLNVLLVALFLTSVFFLGTTGHIVENRIVWAASGAPSGPNVILLGWDGVQRNHLLELVNRGLMPNLNAFVRNGTMVNVTVSDHFTDTKAGWTQILTGYRWWKTGVFNNYFWFHSIPSGYTIPERLENIFGKDQIATAFIAGKLGHMETVDGTGSAAIGSPLAIYTHEAIYRNLPSKMDVVSVGDQDGDRYADAVGPLVLQFLDNYAYNHFFAFFHFSDPDHIGHSYGENSIEYESAIETCDYWLGQILAKLDVLGISQKTLIYVTADHGFDEASFSHFNAPYVFLATNDKNVTRDGDQVDVAPTVYYGMGLWNQSFSLALDGYPLQMSLPPEETQRRQAVLTDTANLPIPTMSIADNGSSQKIVTFNVTDNNLAAVLLLVDNTLKSDGPWNWTQTGPVTATGSYSLNITDLSNGLHIIKILAFDEHGANNGGPDNNPANGGGPSINMIDFYVGPPPLPLPPFSYFPPSSPSLPTVSSPPTPTLPSPVLPPSSFPSTSPLQPALPSSSSSSPMLFTLPSSILTVRLDLPVQTEVVFLVVAVILSVLAVTTYLGEKKGLKK